MMLRDYKKKRVQKGISQNNWKKSFVLACILRHAVRGGVLNDFILDSVLYSRSRDRIREGYEKDLALTFS